MPIKSGHLNRRLEMARYRYEVIRTEVNVLVNVPKLGRYMRYHDELQQPVEEGGYLIPKRHQNGMPVGNGLILNRTFYGLAETDLGRAIVATVVIKTKTMDDGRQFSMFDVTKNTDQTPPSTEIKLMQGETLVEGDTPIIGSDWVIRFKPLE